MIKKRHARILAALTAAVLCISGCSSTPPSLEDEDDTAAAGKSIYRVMYYNEISSLNYLATGVQVDYSLCANLVDCLVDYDSFGNIIPGLAESWSSNEDMTQWTFKIREGVQWVDFTGKEIAEVVADDWVAAAEYVNNAVNESYSRHTYTTGALVHNAQEYYDYTAYMQKSESGTKTTDEDGNEITPVPEVKPEDIGVSAPSKYTLVYTLDQPCPFFLSVLSFSTFMPVNREFLEKSAGMFGRSKENILYNGAFILTEYVPQERRTLIKNNTYWDKDKVYLDEIDFKYRSDVLETGPDLYLQGETDRVIIQRDIMEEWMKDPEKASQVHSMRPDIAYSYFYCFNYDPEFDAAYEPDNWKKAVVNEDFRKALALSLDGIELASVYEPYNPEILIEETITPRTFVSVDGTDYTDLDALKAVKDSLSYDKDAAVQHRDAARAALEKEGVTFPVKVLMPYNPTTASWEQECVVAKRQLEETLGTDFIDVCIEKGPDTGFLSAVRRSGKYAFMLCNYGADYADPDTYISPFTADNTYQFWDTCSDPGIKAVFSEYDKLTKQAETTIDTAERYRLFAEAEALIIEHCIAVPRRVSNGEGYVADKLNQFDGEFAPYGLARERLKGMKLMDKSMSMEEFNAAYDKWESERLSSAN